jgi:hypothetical protein
VKKGDKVSKGTRLGTLQKMDGAYEFLLNFQVWVSKGRQLEAYDYAKTVVFLNELN